MRPEDVIPRKFRYHEVVYEDTHFAVAYGRGRDEDTEVNRLAMRWKGFGPDAIGSPSQLGNPMWFQLPSDDIWISEILNVLDRM